MPNLNKTRHRRAEFLLKYINDNNYYFFSIKNVIYVREFGTLGQGGDINHRSNLF